MTAREFVSVSEDETRALGRRLGENLTGGLCVLLYGDLGAGKTVFVRGVGDALGVSGVRSPSFTLINEYPSPSGLLVAHADLYRLDDAGALGLEEYAGAEDCVLFVEWPERWKNPPVDGVLNVKFEAVSENERKVSFCAYGSLAEGVVMKL